MLLTNGEIYMAKGKLQKLLAKEPPFAVSYGLAVLASKLDPQLGIIEKVRQGLFQTYGYSNPKNPRELLAPLPIMKELDKAGNEIKDKDGEPKMVENPQCVKFIEEYNELMSKETEIVLDIVEIPSTAEFHIEGDILLALLKFIKMVKK